MDCARVSGFARFSVFGFFLIEIEMANFAKEGAVSGSLRFLEVVRHQMKAFNFSFELLKENPFILVGVAIVLTCIIGSRPFRSKTD